MSKSTTLNNKDLVAAVDFFPVAAGVFSPFFADRREGGECLVLAEPFGEV
jgi:hypothetical protein